MDTFIEDFAAFRRHYEQAFIFLVQDSIASVLLYLHFDETTGVSGREH